MVYSIGRNPKAAAKFLKGNSEIKSDLYKTAQKEADEIIAKAKSGDFPVLQKSYEEIMKMFSPQKQRSELSASLDKLETAIIKDKIPQSDGTLNILAEMRKKLNTYLDNVEQCYINGVPLKENAEELFLKENKHLLEKLAEYSDKNIPKELGRDIFLDVVKPNIQITECPSSLLPHDGIYFHGAKKTSGIYKNGLNPLKSNQIFPRELGAAVYLTDNCAVASGFSGIRGSIIPVKTSPNMRIALLSDKQLDDLASEIMWLRMNSSSNPLDAIAIRLKTIKKNSAIFECLFRRIFMDAGYDGIYTIRALKTGGLSGLCPDMNKILGNNQSQLAVFAGENLEIQGRNLAERVLDLKPKSKTFVITIKEKIKYYCKLIKEALMGFKNFKETGSL